MRHPSTKEERRLRDVDFAQRLRPRPVWNSQKGTAIRVTLLGQVGYAAAIRIEKRIPRITEAQDNAFGRAMRRRQNRLTRQSGVPHAQR